MHWRVLVVLEEGAEAEIWEEYLSDDEGLFTTVVELVVGANAKLRFVSGQALSEKGWLFGSQRAVVERDGSLDWMVLGFGGARGKVFMETKLAGAGAHGKVTGAYASHGRQHLDFDTLQDRPDRPRADLLPALARAADSDGPSPGHRGLPRGPRRALRGGAGPPGPRRHPRAPAADRPGLNVEKLHRRNGLVTKRCRSARPGPARCPACPSM